MTGKACVSYFFHYCDKMLDRSNLRKVSFLLSLSLRRSSPMWQESAMTETEMVGPTAPTVRMQRSLSPFYLVWFQPLRWCHVCSECIFLKQTSLETPSEICPEVCPSDDSKSSHGAPPHLFFNNSSSFSIGSSHLTESESESTSYPCKLLNCGG